MTATKNRAATSRPHHGHTQGHDGHDGHSHSHDVATTCTTATGT